MAVEIGALRALLSLDSAAFEAGARRARASMNSLQRSMTDVASRLGQVGSYMTTRVTAPMVAGVGLLANSAVRSAAEIERLAEISGASTTEFQRFAAAARDVGIEQDKLSDILKDTNDRVGDFLATGGGPMADFFENIAPKVGVTAEQFKGLSGPQALQLYVSSLEAANLNQQEMTFYLEAMASDATALIPLLRDNASEMNRLADAAEEAGAVMDEETIEALLSARDAMREAGDAAKGLVNQIIAALAPTLEMLSQRVAQAAQWFSNLSPDMKQLIGIAAALAAAIGPLAIALGFVAVGIAALASPIGVAVMAFAAIAGVVTYVASQWDSLIERFPMLGEAANRATSAFRAWWEMASETAETAAEAVNNAGAGIIAVLTGDIPAAIDHFTIAWAKITEFLHETVSGWVSVIDALVPGFRDWADDVVAAFQDLWADVKAEVEQWPARMQEVGADIGRGLVQGILRGGRPADAELEALGDRMERVLRDRTETQSPSRVFMRIGEDLMAGLGVGIAQNASQAAQAAADAAAQVTGVVEQSIDFMGGLKDASKTIFKDVLSGARNFRQSLSGVLGSMGDKLFNLGVDNLFDAIWPRAMGGPVSAGSTYLVGERGPELFSPRSSGHIIPNHKLGGGGGTMEMIVRSEPGVIVEIVRNETGMMISQNNRAQAKAMPSAINEQMRDPRKGYL